MPLSPKQIDSFNEANKRINIWCGAVRSGKTFSSILKFIDLLKNGPPGDCMIIGVNRETIQRNVLTELYKMLGFPLPASKATEAKLYNRILYFVGAHDESAVRRIQGSTLAFAYVDEITCIPNPFFKMLLSRLSVKGAQLLGTCNPEGPRHWLKKDYIDRCNELDLISWQFQLDDNPSLDPVYKENLKKEYTGMWYKRYILGEWAVAHGLVYDCFDHDNVYERDLEPPNYYIVGIDYGTSNATAAVLCGVSPRKWPQLRIEDEYYYDSAVKGRSKTDAELADDIYKFISHKNISAIYVDPSAASFKLELRNRNLPVLDANNDLVEGIKQTAKFISQKNLIIHKRCTTLLDCIQSYSWDPKAADNGEDRPLKKREHICVTGDTEIWVDGSIWTIKEIVDNQDEIPFIRCKTFDGIKFVYKSFINPNKTGLNKKIMKLTLENEFTLRATQDHKVKTRDGYIEIQDLISNKHEVLCYPSARYSKVLSVVEDGVEDVYCLSVPETGNFVANGIVVKNCDALRYLTYTAFPSGQFSHPAEELTIDQLRRQVYGSDDYPLLSAMSNSMYR